MTDTIIVGIIVLAAACFFARRILRALRSDAPSCNCSGCGQGASCPSRKTEGSSTCNCRQ